MIPLFLFVVPHIVACFLGARKLHYSYLKSRDKNIRDFRTVFALLGTYFASSTLISMAPYPEVVLLIPVRIISEIFLTLSILFFFQIVFRILEKPHLIKFIWIFGAVVIAAEIILRIAVIMPANLVELPPFYYWASGYTRVAPFIIFDILRVGGGITVMGLFFWLGRRSRGILRKRYLLIANGFLLLPIGLGASTAIGTMIPQSFLWFSFSIGAAFALIGLLITLRGIYYRLPSA